MIRTSELGRTSQLVNDLIVKKKKIVRRIRDIRIESVFHVEDVCYPWELICLVPNRKWSFTELLS